MKRALLLLALLAQGCQTAFVRPFSLDYKLVNDNNALLTVEGTTNLPAQAPLEAVLRDERQRQVGHADTTVTPQGTFAMVLDIGAAPGGRPLQLEVHYDPKRAPVHVMAKTGPEGECMGGRQVEHYRDRQILVQRESLLLQMDARSKALRETERGEEGIRELEEYAGRHPNDAQALLMLAVAQLKNRPEERHAGSKAHALLERAMKLGGANQELTLEARLWASRLEGEEKARVAERTRQKKKAPDERLHGNRVIVPGQSLGEIRLGLPLRLLTRRYALDHYGFSSSPDVTAETFSLKGKFQVDVRVDKTSNEVVAVTTHSDFFQMEGGVGVGSLIQEAEEKLGMKLPVTFGAETTAADGSLHSQGQIELSNGLNLLVERRTNPTFPVPVDTIVGVEVVPVVPQE